VITGIVPLDAIRAKAKEKRVTINDFLVAAFIDAYQDVYRGELRERHQKPKHPIRIIVPKNLRGLFGSKTMRNFDLFIWPSIDPRLGHYSFDEILEIAHHSMKLGNAPKPYLSEISRNVRGERNLFLRLLPRKIKDILLAWAFNAFGEKPSSGSVSNLGAVHIPDEMAGHIERFEIIPAPGPKSKCNCGVISFKNNVAISFGRTIRETEVEKHFFRKLVRSGLPVKIFTHGG
jgi:NRPS condensation-like uncharacterized protein